MSETQKETLKRLFIENNLQKEDVFKHQHYTIIKRSGIEKIQANLNIQIQYNVIVCKENFAVIQAMARINDDEPMQTFGSALKGDFKTGNCNTWYVMEMAEKRALSRAVLKLAGFYALGVFAEDEAEEFKQK